MADTHAQLPQLKYLTMAELFLSRAEDDNVGLKFEDRTWTWREVIAAAAVRAGVLRELRPAEGPWHVGVLQENTPEYLFTIAGAALTGATVVGINPTRRGANLAEDIRRTDVAVILTEPSQAGLLDGIDHGASRVIDIESQEYADLLARHDKAPVEATPEGLDPSRTLLLLFTSGSTGAPKAVVCSTGRWAITAQVNPIQFTVDDVAYNSMPLFHGNALMAAWGPCIFSGAALSMRRKFSASGFLPDVRRFGATFFNYVGRSLAYVLAQPEVPEEADNRLRFGFGTEASAKDRSEFLRRYRCPVYESYGSSEGACYIINTPGTPDGALGVPQQGFNPVIIGEDGQECPRAVFDEDGRLLNGEAATGEIVSRGAAARFEGYYNNPEASAEKLRDGDYWTGDLAYRDEDGYFWFAGRTADWIRVDSENFATAPVERILARYPGVAVVAVYPVPDPQTGDMVMATLQMPVNEFDPAGFADFLAAQPDLGTKWAPALVRVTADLPVTATSKVDKPTLRRQLWEGDSVFVRVGQEYQPLDEDKRAQLAARFAEHGRSALIGG